MTWIRRHLLLFAALGVLVYMLIPNLVVAMFSFNDPVGRYNYTWAALLRRRVAQPVRGARASASRSGCPCGSGSSPR